MLIIHSPLSRSFPEVVRSEVFTRLRVLKKRSAVQVVDAKVKAINHACRTAAQNSEYQIAVSSNLLLAVSSSFKCFHILYLPREGFDTKNFEFYRYCQFALLRP